MTTLTTPTTPTEPYPTPRMDATRGLFARLPTEEEGLAVWAGSYTGTVSRVSPTDRTRFRAAWEAEAATWERLFTLYHGLVQRHYQAMLVDNRLDTSALNELDANYARYLVGSSNGPELRLITAVANQYRQELRRVRARAGTTGARQRVWTEAPDQVRRIVPGDDLPSVLPTEWALTGSELTRPLFYNRLVREELMQVERQGIDRVNINPLVLIVDTTGSMDTMVRSWQGFSVSKKMWAKAVAVLMINIARHIGRPLLLVPFQNRAEAVEITPATLTPLSVMLDGLGASLGGGTEYVAWLRLVRGQAARLNWRYADVVMISDGMPGDDARALGPELQKWRAASVQHGLRTLGVFLSDYEDPTSDFAVRRGERVQQQVAELYRVFSHDHIRLVPEPDPYLLEDNPALLKVLPQEMARVHAETLAVLEFLAKSW